MISLEELLRAAGIPFCRHGNRIRLVTVIYIQISELIIYFNQILGAFRMS